MTRDLGIRAGSPNVITWSTGSNGKEELIFTSSLSAESSCHPPSCIASSWGWGVLERVVIRGGHLGNLKFALHKCPV